MRWSRKPQLTLSDLDRARTTKMLHSLGALAGHPPDAAVEAPEPGRKEVARLSDEDIAELLSREPGTRLYQLAASVDRTREAWRGPARWSLVIAALSFIIALSAFVRTM